MLVGTPIPVDAPAVPGSVAAQLELDPPRRGEAKAVCRRGDGGRAAAELELQRRIPAVGGITLVELPAQTCVRPCWCV